MKILFVSRIPEKQLKTWANKTFQVKSVQFTLAFQIYLIHFCRKIPMNKNVHDFWPVSRDSTYRFVGK